MHSQPPSAQGSWGNTRHARAPDLTHKSPFYPNGLNPRLYPASEGWNLFPIPERASRGADLLRKNGLYTVQVQYSYLPLNSQPSATFHLSKDDAKDGAKKGVKSWKVSQACGREVYQRLKKRSEKVFDAVKIRNFITGTSMNEVNSKAWRTLEEEFGRERLEEVFAQAVWGTMRARMPNGLCDATRVVVGFQGLVRTEEPGLRERLSRLGMGREHEHRPMWEQEGLMVVEVGVMRES
ncbi:MAG: hypothetical protein M1820_001474 [Bogoriella megaspora]|nr:MAG: hypothetical protein M1820_001474 [Bogoriella megaspora]